MMSKNFRVVIASPHPRHDVLEQALRKSLGIEILRVREREDLEVIKLSEFLPRYVFFPHWSWIIPAEIYEKFECIIFHMTDLPFGRGGSPLQNLIVRGIKETKLSAFRCVASLDSGPVYMKQSLTLMGTAEEILLRAAQITEKMIEYIVREQPEPIQQTGKPTEFRRRLPGDGNLASLDELGKMFDYIRMLDADGYPAAFVETDYFRFEFSRATMNSEDVVAKVKITRRVL